MLRLAVPGFCTVKVCDCELPVRTLLKPMLDGVTLTRGWTPLPLREIVDEGFEALLAMLILPVAVPAVVGENTAISERVCPADKLALPENPLTLKPLPLAASWEMLMVAVPEFVIVNGKEPEVPTRRFPNARLSVLTESRELAVEDGTLEIPVPETATLVEPKPCLPPLITMMPLKFAAASGLKETIRIVLLRAASQSGVLMPLTTNSGRLLVTLEMSMF